VPPALRRAAEASLRPGETLSAFLEGAVRETIERRQAQNAFIERGLASRERARRTGRYHSSEDVLRGLERKLKSAKRSR
jgi:predicted transcriptional regulator